MSGIFGWPIFRWGSYTPVVTNDGGGGTIGTISGRYLAVPFLRIVFLQLKATVSNATGASGKIYFSYPSGLLIDSTYMIGQFSGRENGVTGKMLLGLLSTTVVGVGNYDDSSAITNTGAQINVSGWYRY